MPICVSVFKWLIEIADDDNNDNEENEASVKATEYDLRAIPRCEAEAENVEKCKCTLM